MSHAFHSLDLSVAVSLTLVRLILFLLISFDFLPLFLVFCNTTTTTTTRIGWLCTFNKHSKRFTPLFVLNKKNGYSVTGTGTNNNRIACMKLSCFDLLPGCANNNNNAAVSQATWNKTLLTHSLTCIDSHTNTDERNEIEKLYNRLRFVCRNKSALARQEPRGMQRPKERNEKKERRKKIAATKNFAGSILHTKRISVGKVDKNQKPKYDGEQHERLN